MAMVTVAKVAVENTTYQFDKAFDYLVPQHLLKQAKEGCRVMVPFGFSNSCRQGVILALEQTEDDEKRKSVVTVLDEAPFFTSELLNMVTWLKERYFCTLYDAVKLLLPTGLNMKLKTVYSLAVPLTEIQQLCTEEELHLLTFLSHVGSADAELLKKTPELLQNPKLPEQLVKKGWLHKAQEAVRQINDATQKMVRLTERYRDGIQIPKLTAKQKDVYHTLCDIGTASVKEICYFTGVTTAVVQNLVKRGVAEFYDIEIFRNPYEAIEAPKDTQAITLSNEQQTAFNHLKQQYETGKSGVSLLYGVTGSGKTLVFMKLIDEVYQQGKGVIVMVPEISLTPQTIGRFHKRYGNRVAVFHSALSMGERLDEWKRVKNGQALIAVGTRSAVFAPFEHLGLIIMDEEQEYTYKSESSPRYHAREVAKYRCAYHNALLVLASATPSLESYFMAENGRYSLESLPHRYGDAKLPEVIIADMNEQLSTGNTTAFSNELIQALEENLERKEQSILLLNRRGYHTFVSCKHCGEVVTCPSCSISLTYHSANNRLMCHYCGYSVPFTKECPGCHEPEVSYTGSGTQKAEEELCTLFPKARILRLDADSTMRRHAYETKMKAFSNGEYDIIIGTQMVAKGLDFENVTLVGVLSADQVLYSDDFRSNERGFDLMTQVVGRSGRGTKRGRAIIQTYTPENPVIALASHQDYVHFYQQEILFRKAMLYPPFADIVVIGFVGEQESKVAKASQLFLEMLSHLASKEYSELPIRALRPTPAQVAKVSNKYRYKLMIKCKNNLTFRTMLSRLLVACGKEKAFAGVTVYADSNPDMI